MTEQRAIDLLKGILPKKVSFAQMICASNCYGDEMVYQEPEPYAIEFAINSIQENAKLKAEIERSNGKSEMYRDMADSFCNSNIKLEAEIEQWQSTNLKLVCELTRIECENHQLKSELEQSVKLPCKVGDVLFSIESEHVEEFKVKSLSHIVTLLEFNRFNDTVFLTKKEAEQSLKGQV